MNATAPITRHLRISDLLRAVWPRHAAKRAAAASGLSVRTCQGWLADRCSPSAETLIRMARGNDELRAVLMKTLVQDERLHEEPTVDRRVAAGGARGTSGERDAGSSGRLGAA